MTSRSYDGVGYYAPSFASDTPIYDSLVAERGVPQIAPISVPAALPPAYDSFGSSSYGAPSSYGTSNAYGSSFGGYGSNLPAVAAPRLALGPGPSSPSYTQPAPAQYPAPQAYIPQQPNYGSGAGGYTTPPQGTAMPPVTPLRPSYPQGQQGQQGQQGYAQQPQGGYQQPSPQAQYARPAQQPSPQAQYARPAQPQGGYAQPQAQPGYGQQYPQQRGY